MNANSFKSDIEMVEILGCVEDITLSSCVYRPAIISILIGLAVMYVADFTFSWTTTSGSFYNADWGDLLLTLGLSLLSFGTLGFSTKPHIARPKSEGEET